MRPDCLGYLACDGALQVFAELLYARPGRAKLWTRT